MYLPLTNISYCSNKHYTTVNKQLTNVSANNKLMVFMVNNGDHVT